MLKKINKNKINISKKIKIKNAYILIETMIAIIIFSVAMVGLLFLQVKGMNSSQSSGYRTLASNYAYDLMDKMRSNRDGVLAGNYIATSGVNNSCRSTNYNINNLVIICNTAKMAQDDLFEFFSEVTSLPNGSAIICLDSSRSSGTPTNPNCDGLGNDIVIKIFWKNSATEVSGLNSGYSQVIIGAQL